MNKKILETLEFSKIKELFTPYLLTEQGHLELSQLQPTSKKETLAAAFLEMTDMQQIFVQQPHFSLGAIQDITGLTKRLELDSDLNIEEFLALKRVLAVTHELISFYEDLENVQLERLNRLFDNLVEFPSIQGNLQAINDGGFVESFASEELARIRRKIQENENQMREILQEILKTKGDMLADQVVASMAVMCYRSKIPTATAFPVWFTIFQPAGIPSISSLEQLSISTRKLPML